MFLSYEYKTYIGYDQATGLYNYRFRIIDSNFDIDVIEAGNTVGTAVEISVIKEYSKRNLNVAGNLARVFQYESQKYGYSISRIVAWNSKYNSEFKKYEKELEKYLCLI